MAKGKIWMSESGNNVGNVIQADILMKVDVYVLGHMLTWQSSLKLSVSILSTAVKNHKFAIRNASLGYYPNFVTGKPNPPFCCLHFKTYGDVRYVCSALMLCVTLRCDDSLP
jgi:hypothetical protein